MNRKIVPVQKLPNIYLKPGEVLFGLEASRVITVLGSCVSVTMYNRAKRIGAMCHAVMPLFNQAMRKSSASKDVFQYVDSSLEWMLEQFARIGVMKNGIEVKIFGGSGIFSGCSGSESISIGRKNIEAATKTLQEQNMRLMGWDVGGNKGRKVIFYTDTGEVFTKYVTRLDPQLDMYSSGIEK